MPPSRQPSRADLVRALGEALQQYQRSVQAFDDAVGRRLGLGPADLRCLDWLADGPKTAGQLSVATGLRPAATTALIDRLEARGLVRRTRSATDRRSVLVEMTDHGHARTWEAYGPLVAAGQPMLDELSREQLEFMHHYLVRMRELTDEYRERLADA
jgi:DNA-binding MarR family transcriptional regulator